VVRETFSQDLRAVYKELIFCDQPKFQNNLGKVHDILFDFLRWEENLPKWARHSTLHKHLKNRGSKTIWIHWGRIGKKPSIYEGDKHDLAERWQKGELIKGVVVRIAGNGSIKCCMMPREHLKSSVARAFTLQEILRDPSIRIMAKTQEKKLAYTYVAKIKEVFEKNRVFNKYYSHLRPDYKESLWSTEGIQVRSDIRRGTEPTLYASALNVEVTGDHPDLIILDDIVGEKNVHRQTPVREKVSNLGAVMASDGGRILDLGTRWAEDDAHGMFVGLDDKLFKYASFIHATLTDENDDFLWPQAWDEEKAAFKRAFYSDYSWMCQYYNNPYAGARNSFKPEWIRYYDEFPNAANAEYKITARSTPEEIADAFGLDIFITIDPARKNKRNCDDTAVMVRGQTQDAQYRFILDGIADRISTEDMPIAIMNLIEKWSIIARRARGNFRVAVEVISFEGYLRYPLANEARKRGIAMPTLEEIAPENRKKTDRINTLIRPYSAGAIYMPRKLPKDGAKGHYDFIEAHNDQLLKFPNGSKDDVIDVEAYSEQMMRPLPMHTTPTKSEKVYARPGEYSREKQDDLARIGGRAVPVMPTKMGAALQSQHPGQRVGGRLMPGKVVPR
jgi:phage terminase large subunit-like protein